jgi:hypothetical protein
MALMQCTVLHAGSSEPMCGHPQLHPTSPVRTGHSISFLPLLTGALPRDSQGCLRRLQHPYPSSRWYHEHHNYSHKYPLPLPSSLPKEPLLLYPIPIVTVLPSCAVTSGSSRGKRLRKSSYFLTKLYFLAPLILSRTRRLRSILRFESWSSPGTRLFFVPSIPPVTGTSVNPRHDDSNGPAGGRNYHCGPT